MSEAGIAGREDMEADQDRDVSTVPELLALSLEAAPREKLHARSTGVSGFRAVEAGVAARNSETRRWKRERGLTVMNPQGLLAWLKAPR
eukprot:3719934-Rhodomonas_salina.1